MTGARLAGVPAAFTMEFGCARACQVEIDLEDVQVRYTLGQMIARAETVHDKAHAANPVPVFRYSDTVVRAALVVAS